MLEITISVTHDALVQHMVPICPVECLSVFVRECVFMSDGVYLSACVSRFRQTLFLINLEQISVNSKKMELMKNIPQRLFGKDLHILSYKKNAVNNLRVSCFQL